VPPRKRRPRGLGSVTTRADGQVVARCWLPLPDGRRVRQAFYGPDAAAAEGKMLAARQAALAGLVPADRQPLAAFLQSWLEQVKRPRVEASTFERQEAIVRLHLVPALGHHRLGALRPQHVALFLGERQRAGYAPGTVRQLHAVLHNALQTAVRWELVPRNVAALAAADLPRLPRREPPVLDPTAARALLAAAPRDRLGALYVVALTTGLRRGELCGLRWADIDLERARLHVRQQHSRTRAGLAEKLPKSKRARVVDLAALTVEALRAHRAAQAQERLAQPGSWPRPDLVFTTPTGAPLHATPLGSYHFRRFLAAAGLPPLTLHGLRHSFASLLLSEGEDLATVSAMLGHADPAITLRVYRHLFEGEGRRTARRLDALLGGAGGGPVADRVQNRVQPGGWGRRNARQE